VVERVGAVLVSVGPHDPVPEARDVDRLASLPCVVIVVAQGDTALAPGWAALSDVVLGEGDDSLDDIEATVAAQPIASTSLALLLRGDSHRSVEEGLVAESAVYSMLQAGPEFAAWRAASPPRSRPCPDDGARVRVERADSLLRVTLTRPDRRNALDAAMRDELADAFGIALADPAITRVELRGDGPSFCAGGDLDEFGSRADPASAHVIRLQRSLARAVHELAAKTTAYLHGPCVGSGIELPAFAGTVVAHPGTTISLPELRLGLIPGAGGTVSLPRRIGRHRTAWLALSARAIDAATARSWGLVDALDQGEARSA
jgi:enoyl-CoA hydratase/carnithine racemase